VRSVLTNASGTYNARAVELFNRGATPHGVVIVKIG
jgi:hypothetical protein